MKRALYLVLKSGTLAFNVLEGLKREGFNATLISTESLRHAIDDFPEDHHFYNLRHFEQKQQQESILGLFVTEADRIEVLKAYVRKFTNNFQDVHGFMYSVNIEDYEGSI